MALLLLLRAPMRDTSGPVGSGSSREGLSQVYKLALFSVETLCC